METVCKVVHGDKTSISESASKKGQNYTWFET